MSVFIKIFTLILAVSHSWHSSTLLSWPLLTFEKLFSFLHFNVYISTSVYMNTYTDIDTNTHMVGPSTLACVMV